MRGGRRNPARKAPKTAPAVGSSDEMLAQHRQGSPHEKGRQKEDRQRQEELGEDKERSMALKNFKERSIERAIQPEQQKVQQGRETNADFQQPIGFEQIGNEGGALAPIPSADTPSEEEDGMSRRRGVSRVSEEKLKFLEPQNLIDKPHGPGKEKEKVDNALFKQRKFQQHSPPPGRLYANAHGAFSNQCHSYSQTRVVSMERSQRNRLGQVPSPKKTPG